MYGPDARVLILLVACLEGVLKLRACSKNSSFGVLYVAHSKMLARNLACTYYVVLNEISLSVRQPSPLRPGFRGRNLVAMSVATVLPLHRSVIVTNKHSLIMSKSSITPASSNPALLGRYVKSELVRGICPLNAGAAFTSCLRRSYRMSKVSSRNVVPNTFSTTVLATTSVVLQGLSKICYTLWLIFVCVALIVDCLNICLPSLPSDFVQNKRMQVL